VAQLIALRALSLAGCRGMRDLPAALVAMTALTALDLGGCAGLRRLPECSWDLQCLEALDLRGCRCGGWTDVLEGQTERQTDDWTDERRPVLLKVPGLR
jgi:hypothetical protein